MRNAAVTLMSCFRHGLSRCVGSTTLLVLVLVGSLAGCGYKLAGTGGGTFLPEHIRVINLEAFENRTTRPEIEQRVTEEIARQFSRRGRYRVVTTLEGADASLEGVITGYRTEPVEFNPEGRATRMLAIVTIQATFRDLSNDEVLWSQSGLNFRDEFAVPQVGEFFDQETLAIERIAVEAGGAVVSSLLEGF
jgi:outer membrane lipopolysaccharide assembly protein LptE/RlpB